MKNFIYTINIENKKWKIKKELNHWLDIINFDFSSIRVSDDSEGFLGEINGGLATRRWATIHDFDSDFAPARLRYAGVGGTGASNPVHSSARSSVAV